MAAERQARPLLLGHRGCRLKQFPENSMRAFRHALAAGCDGFEFDVRTTADGKLVCLHDDAIGKTLVAEGDYDELCKEYLKDSPDHAEPIARLEGVLSEFGASAFLDIELKVAGSERAVLDLLARYRPQQFVVSSFLAEALADLAEANSEIPLGYIFDDVAGLRVYPNLPVKYLMPRHDLLTPESIEAFRRDGYQVLAWTVNRAAEMARLAKWGLDGLISDDPALLHETMSWG